MIHRLVTSPHHAAVQIPVKAVVVAIRIRRALGR